MGSFWLRATRGMPVLASAHRTLYLWPVMPSTAKRSLLVIGSLLAVMWGVELIDHETKKPVGSIRPDGLGVGVMWAADFFPLKC